MLWKDTCIPIKTHVISKLFYKSNYGVQVPDPFCFNAIEYVISGKVLQP